MAKIEKVMVIGASGDQGTPLVSALIESGAEVVCGARRLDAMAATPHPDLATVIADINDVASLETAFAEVDAVAMHLPFEHEVARAATFGQNIATAAKTAGLKKLVFNTSCYVSNTDLDLGGHDGRRRIEQSIRDSGVDYVILRPVVFMDNAVRVWLKPAIVNNDKFVYPASEQLKISWICLEDLGKLLAYATLNEDILNETITVGGPESLTGHEVAQRISAAAGRAIAFDSISPQVFAENMSELVTGSREVDPDSVYSGMAKFYQWYNEQETSPLAIKLTSFSDKFPLKLKSYQEWANQQDWSTL